MSRVTAIVLAAAALLSGCATTQAPPATRTTVPAARVMLAGAQGDAEIVVVRDAGFMGGGCFYALSVNRRPVARMDTGETLRMRVPAGDLLLAVGRDPQGKALCGLEPDHKVQREFSLKAGETKHFRIAIGNGGLDVMRSDY